MNPRSILAKFFGVSALLLLAAGLCLAVYIFIQAKFPSESEAKIRAEEAQRAENENREFFKQWFQNPIADVQKIEGGCHCWQSCSCEYVIISKSQLTLRYGTQYKKIKCATLALTDMFGQYPALNDDAELVCQVRERPSKGDGTTYFVLSSGSNVFFFARSWDH